jgi:ATP-dependent Clp protease protease subunit
VNKPFLKAQSIAERFRVVPANGAKRPLFASADKGKTGELFIYEQIGFDCWTGDGVTGKSVQEALAKMSGVETLNIYINCEGGDVFEAKAIYTALCRFNAKKVVHVDGIAASAATFVAMAGDKIITSPVATWMVHQAWSGAVGRAVDMRAMADLLDLENRNIAETYSRRTKGDVDEMLALMAAPPDGTWMNAESALEKGFTDEIGVSATDDEGEDAPAALAASATGTERMAAAISMTQRRIKTLSTSKLLEMHLKDRPGQPGERRPPASR